MLFHEWLLRQERLLRETGRCDVPGVTASGIHDTRGFPMAENFTAASSTICSEKLNQQEVTMDQQLQLPFEKKAEPPKKIDPGCCNCCNSEITREDSRNGNFATVDGKLYCSPGCASKKR